MGKPTTIVKHYHLTHADMIGAVKTIFDLFVIDKPDFVIYDPDFGGQFENDWQDDIDAAEDFDSDETVLDQQRQLTEAVEAKMDECRHKFQDSKRFIEKAFPDNGTIWDEFGYDNYGKVRNKQLEMVLFMKLFHNAADKYKAQLIAKNYTQAMIDEIMTLRIELDTANRKQETFIKNRKTITRNRQIAYNKIWDTMVDVCKAGQSIYHDNAAKYEQYLIPDNRTGNGGTPPVQEAITAVTDQTVLQQITVAILGTNGEQVDIAWGDTNTTPAPLVSNKYTFFPHDYAAPGIYEIGINSNVAAIREIQFIAMILLSILFPEGMNPRAINVSDNQLSTLGIPNTFTNLLFLFAQSNNLNETSINNLLIVIEAFGTSNGQIYLNGGTNASPTGAGLTAKAALQARGWTVNTN